MYACICLFVSLWPVMLHFAYACVRVRMRVRVCACACVCVCVCVCIHVCGYAELCECIIYR